MLMLEVSAGCYLGLGGMLVRCRGRKRAMHKQVFLGDPWADVVKWEVLRCANER